MIAINHGKKQYTNEIIILIILSILVVFFSSLQVKNSLSIWNQNDEFGTWQGGAWILGLDWSEVVSTNGYYGYGYGFILAFFIKFFGKNTVLMTHIAMYFQVFMHTSCIFIAWYCVRKMFPCVNTTTRVIASTVCILSISDLFYNYMFFSECILRFLVWLTFGVVVSYVDQKKWYKLLVLNMIAVYAFTIHQRCILLLGMSLLFTLYEMARYLREKEFKVSSFVWMISLILGIVLFYIIVYKCANDSYILKLYSANGNESVGGNLLSERGYTIKGILKNVIFNIETERIAMQNLLGHIYYACAFDCGFLFFGFLFCMMKIKNSIILKKIDNSIPYIYMSSMMVIGILLVVYQNANEGVYSIVEAMHYGRYCSYLFAPMIMFGIIWLLTETNKRIRKGAIMVILVFLLAGLSTYKVLKLHDVVSLFAFSNACPGIKSIYYTENPYTATLYHTVLGVTWILIPAIVIGWSKKYIGKKKRYLEIGTFVIISFIWISIANKEWNEQYSVQKAYVTQTYDLQNILNDVDEFVAFKSFVPYGSGLLQYNNPYSKIHICQSLEEFNVEVDNLLVVSQKGIEEMDDIIDRYDVKYENNRYFVWLYKKEK